MHTSTGRGGGPDEVDQPPIRILIVDDHEANRILLQCYLSILGYETLEARDGLEAITIASRESPHVILMDLKMPRLDGLGATAQLKCMASTRHIPILAVSTDCFDAGRRVVALEAGCEECLEKPVDLVSLKAALERYLAILQT